MNDFMVWFLQNHWLAAALLLPEVSLVFALWMKQYFWAACCAAVWVARKGLENEGVQATILWKVRTLLHSRR